MNCQADVVTSRLLGHRETHPLITQEALSASHTEKLKLSFLLFDEIEKPAMRYGNCYLACWIKPRSTLGDNRRVTSPRPSFS